MKVQIESVLLLAHTNTSRVHTCECCTQEQSVLQASILSHRQSTGASIMVDIGMWTGSASLSASEHGIIAYRPLPQYGVDMLLHSYRTENDEER